MVNQYVWIGITVGVFFAGIGVSYAIFSSTYDPGTMKFQNQQLFDQMMSHNPKMSAQWMGSMTDSQQMQQMMNTMMGDPQFQQQMMNDPQFQQHMQEMMGNPQFQQQMMGMMGNPDLPEDEVMTSYVEMIDGVQVVTIHGKEFKFIPSEISIAAGKTKFVFVNDGVAEHELVVYEISKKEMIAQAELAEDEETIEENILFEIEEVHGGESGESEVMDLNGGTYEIACHVPGHYNAGMYGTLTIES